MTTKNKTADCTHRVPKNHLGYFAMHCLDNQPLPTQVAKDMIDGPLDAMQPKLTKELAGKNDRPRKKEGQKAK